MKKIIMAILAITSLTCNYVSPVNYTNKTFMSLPTPHYYLPMKYSSWHRILKQGSSTETPWGSTLQFTPFYRMSDNDTGLGKYFGTNYKNIIKIGRTSPETDLRTDLIVQNATGYSNLIGTLRLSPKHTSYGIYFSFHQELNNINKGLFVQVNIPLQHVENDLRLCTTDERSDPSGGVCEYFSGNFRQTDDPNKQEPLQYLRMCGPQNQSGIADLEVLVGKKFVEKEEHQISAAVKLIVPTGNRPSPCYLFPPVIGNGRHWGLGATVDGSMNVTKGTDYSLEFLFNLDYTYVFKSCEKRTLGYRRGFDDSETLNEYETSSVMAWAYYVLAGEEGKLGVFPFANVLTRDVNVLPGAKLQGHTSLAYHRNNTTFDFGYSFLSLEGEKVTVKCWQNDKYAPAHPDYSTDVAFGVLDYAQIDPPGWSIGGPIQSTMIDCNTPATPASLKHSIHAAISYTHSEWENPLVMGCGFSVDWTQDNSTATGYVLWGKVGVSF